VRPFFYSNLFIITPTDVHILQFFGLHASTCNGVVVGGGVYDRYVDITANRRNYPANKHLVERGWGRGGGGGRGVEGVGGGGVEGVDGEGVEGGGVGS
jgi:hypothetical protein